MSENQITEIVDKNIDKLVDAISKMGPQAEYAFNETLAIISVQAWAYVSLILVSLPAGIVWLCKSVKFANKENYWGDAATLQVALSGILTFLAGLMFLVAFPRELSRALHPIGYLVLKTLE